MPQNAQQWSCIPLPLRDMLNQLAIWASRVCAESSLPVAHPGYQVFSDILFRLGLIANALRQCSSQTVEVVVIRGLEGPACVKPEKWTNKIKKLPRNTMILSLKLTHFWHIHVYPNAYMGYWFSASLQPNEQSGPDKIVSRCWKSVLSFVRSSSPCIYRFLGHMNAWLLIERALKGQDREKQEKNFKNYPEIPWFWV